MGVGCQSRRFNCLFWRETRQRILGHEISPYPEVVRGGEWELTTRARERERVGGWRAERRELVVGHERGELVAGPENESWWLDPRMRVDDATQREELVAGDQERQLVAGEQRGKQQKAVAAGQERGEQQKLAWKNGGAVNTRHRNREARRQDRVQ